MYGFGSSSKPWATGASVCCYSFSVKTCPRLYFMWQEAFLEGEEDSWKEEEEPTVALRITEAPEEDPLPPPHQPPPTEVPTEQADHQIPAQACSPPPPPESTPGPKGTEEVDSES
ncbi:UNVERIFIED_CONTAM: hypothetical protein K2H54_053584 [Gekko kuhli]